VKVETVTTTDRSLLGAVRATLMRADEAFLCVAFVHEKGLHLLSDELKHRKNKKLRSRLLVTTTFQPAESSALSVATGLGLEVRILNPGSGRTFHPKLYLGLTGRAAEAVIGSANLTGGLATNLEAAVALRGRRDDAPIARAWEWAEELWADERVAPWIPRAAELAEEPFEPILLAALRSAVKANPVFMTLGPRPAPNRVVDLSPVAVFVETARSRQRVGGAEPIPAWMLNLAWERLRTFGRLSNTELLNDLRVHRSSAVCAILARLPQVERAPGKEIVLRWR
jgi:hypothetical protein